MMSWKHWQEEIDEFAGREQVIVKLCLIILKCDIQVLSHFIYSQKRFCYTQIYTSNTLLPVKWLVVLLVILVVNTRPTEQVKQAMSISTVVKRPASRPTFIKERANTAWTDIKTKAGDVKVQAGEGFDPSRTVVSNVKNQAISASTEGLSNKVRNFSDAIETDRQNIHNTLDSLGNKNRLAFYCRWRPSRSTKIKSLNQDGWP